MNNFSPSPLFSSFFFSILRFPQQRKKKSSFDRCFAKEGPVKFIKLHTWWQIFKFPTLGERVVKRIEWEKLGIRRREFSFLLAITRPTFPPIVLEILVSHSSATPNPFGRGQTFRGLISPFRSFSNCLFNNSNCTIGSANSFHQKTIDIFSPSLCPSKWEILCMYTNEEADKCARGKIFIYLFLQNLWECEETKERKCPTRHGLVESGLPSPLYMYCKYIFKFIFFKWKFIYLY